MERYFKITLILMLPLVFLSCKNDSEEELYGLPNEDPEPEVVSYSVDLVPFLENSCVSCHSSAFPTAGIALDTYENVKIFVDNGSLLGSIKHESGFSPMPKGQDKWADYKIKKFENWIEDGAPNN